jgi:hypothetical protein
MFGQLLRESVFHLQQQPLVLSHGLIQGFQESSRLQDGSEFQRAAGHQKDVSKLSGWALEQVHSLMALAGVTEIRVGGSG